MVEPKHSLVPLRSAAFFSAALVLFLVGGWVMVAAVQAQGPGPTEIRGTLVNGTGDAPESSIANVPVTLFQITTAGPVTRTVPTDAQGEFLFTNVITNGTAYFTRLDYAGIRYFSDIMPPELAAVTPISVTVYETQTIPADFLLDRVHLILDVQPKRFNGLALVQLTNPTDRVFYLPLPVPNDTSDVQFEDIREQTIVRRQEDGTILYPILPTTTDILYGIVLPYTPPDYRLEMPLATNVSAFSLLVAEAGGVIASGNKLTPAAPFTSQNGQVYSVFTGPAQPAGSTFGATISNLPGVDNSGTVQTLLLVGGGLGALALLAFPVYQRRTTRTKSSAVSERMEQLQALARLDDAHDAGQIEDDVYFQERAALKAELLKDKIAEHPAGEPQLQ